MLWATLVFASSAAFGQGRPVSCATALGFGRADVHEQLPTQGTSSAEVKLSLSVGHEWLIETREAGNDALVELRDAADHVLAQADHPERRTGSRRLIVVPRETSPLTLWVSGKEHAAVRGGVEIAAFDLAALSTYPVCARVYHFLASADADYAVAQQISLGRLPAGAPTAHDFYQRAARAYEAAEGLIDNRADAALRAEVDLALAGIWYFDLQDWRRSAEWAQAAQHGYGNRDRYRLARAQALLAAAWVEMATMPPSSGVPGGSDPKAVLHKARRIFEQLSAFHSRRKEPYDAALQINNIAIAYSYEGRFDECVVAARSAGRMFARIGEIPRQALAWQNQAMCYWGLGHLPQALGAFDRALKGMTPDPYPQLYLLTLNNTALMNYVLGHFDESLHLHDRALELAIRSQNQREEAQSLYGIGVTYYALGDRELARDFLERSLALRTAVFDGRGRRATLRSLATLYADLGEYRKAIELDQESLLLASAPRSRALSRIQLAVHTALAGSPGAALDTLDELIRPGAVNDALITAQARLERSVVERRDRDYRAALRDLQAAIPVFRRLGSVFDQFSADLERAKTLQLEGEPAASFVAVEHALAKSEAIRTQSANPELRAQLQLPLRAAYDLKLELLWTRYAAALTAGKQAQAALIAEAAFKTADGARAQSFRDIARQQYSATVRRELGSALERREQLYQTLAGLRFTLESRLDRSGSGDPRGKRLQSEIAELQREVDTLNSGIAAHAALRGMGERSVPLNPAHPALHLSGDMAIIAYWMGNPSAYSWTVTPEGIHWVRLPDSAAITAAVRTFHDSLQRFSDVSRMRRLDAAAAVYEKILGPLEQWIRPYRQWYVVPDAALGYVAFPALRNGSGADAQFMVTSHDIALTPAAWLLVGPGRRSEAGRDAGRMLLVSDPVYELSDPRMSPGAAPGASAQPTGLDRATAQMSGQSYRRLSGTAREAAAIQAEFSTGSIDAFNGFGATREHILQADWSRYRFVHIATHGHVDARIPQLSALILTSYNQRRERLEDALRSADVSALTLNAELAVFSGCDTALGREVLNEGMVGLAYTTLARGAGAVVSSLWQVPDEMTATLMTEFYRHLLRDSMTPATALSAAMRSVLSRNPAADPALWAAFQVSVLGIPGGGSDPIRSRTESRVTNH